MKETAFLQCIRPSCGTTYDLSAQIYECQKCGNLLDVAYDWNRLNPPKSLSFFQQRWATRNNAIDHSGVWRFRELLPFAGPDEIVTIREGQTLLQAVDVPPLGLPLKTGRLHLQYEGMNPSGSFKDNGMTAGFTMARKLGCPRVGCASTGNTSASMALYAAKTHLADGRLMQAIVFIGAGKIAYGKLAQALDYGALTLQIAGDFDACMKRIREATDRLGLYLMNSVNPFRLEGQKTIMYRVLEGLGWEPPDWIFVPGGNLGNSSAFGKAYIELKQLGLVKRVPRICVVNATGANTLWDLYNNRGLRWNNGDWDKPAADKKYAEMDAKGQKAKTIASAIEIARPVNLSKELRTLDAMNGVVCEVTDEQILEEKALIGKYGYGCEPASAASLAGLRQMIEKGTLDRDARVVCILTGHPLKDPDATVRYHTGLEPTTSPPTHREPWGKHANRPIKVPDDLDAICRVIEEHRS
ncbi:MAG TPA: threonine synthase [Phycisphaerae bacterium]|nr:threonine synthase [Phycisphaerae bacterium]